MTTYWSTIKNSNTRKSDHTSEISGKCPACGKHVVFTSSNLFEDYELWEYLDAKIGFPYLDFGFRFCPNSDCDALIVFSRKIDPAGFVKGITIYPSQKFIWDNYAVPTKIIDCFDEALECFSVDCYRATSVMIRQTLEHICTDKGVTGSNLVKRIIGLEQYLSKDVVSSMDLLREFGNDGAHETAKNYDVTNPDVIKTAIELMTQILGQIYTSPQRLLDSKQALKKYKQG